METKQLSNVAQQPTQPTQATAPAAGPARGPQRPRPAAAPAADNMSYSNAEAMRIMMRAGQTGRDLAAKLRNSAAKDEISAKQQGVRDQAAQIQGERVSVVQGLASKILATGVQAGAGAVGTKMRQSTIDSHKSIGAGLDGTAQGGQFGNVITGASDMADKLHFGQYDADQAKIALKQDDVQTSIASQRKDSAAAGVTQADKVIDTAMDALKDFRSRAAEVINKLTGG